MAKFFGRACAAVVLSAMGINAVLMLISPRLWWRMPGWLRANGRFTYRDTSTLGRALGIRITGALLTLFVSVLTLGLVIG
jgi:hypothetical protein